MAPKATDPPTWQEDQSWEDYKKEIEIWELMKTCEATQQGPYLFRVLTGKAKEAANELTKEQISSNTGLKLIIDKIEGFNLVDKNERIFTELERFEKFRRSSSMSMSSFLSEFERLHNKVKNYDCKYPDGVLAYKLLLAANLTQDDKRLCKATIATGKWSYASVIEQLNKISDNISLEKSETPDRAIKLEPTFYANHRSRRYESYEESSEGEVEEGEDQGKKMSCKSDEEHGVYYGNNNRRNNYYQRNYRDQDRKSSNRPGYRRFSNNESQNQPRKYINVNISKLKDLYNSDPEVPNPKDDRGFPTTCRRCRSIYHWLQDCPHKDSSNKDTTSKSKVYYGSDPTDEVYISLFQTSTTASVDEVRCLVGETLDMAVIDSGCPTNVCGKKWFSNYCESMSENERAKLQSERSTKSFRFGDSQPITSMKRVLLPITLTDKNMYLPTDVVEMDIPLLLSKETQER